MFAFDRCVTYSSTLSFSLLFPLLFVQDASESEIRIVQAQEDALARYFLEDFEGAENLFDEVLQLREAQNDALIATLTSGASSEKRLDDQAATVLRDRSRRMSKDLNARHTFAVNGGHVNVEKDGTSVALFAPAGTGLPSVLASLSGSPTAKKHWTRRDSLGKAALRCSAVKLTSAQEQVVTNMMKKEMEEQFVQQHRSRSTSVSPIASPRTSPSRRGSGSGGGSPHERSDTYEDRIRRLSPGRTKQRRPSRLSIGSTSASSSPQASPSGPGSGPRSTDDYTAADFAKQKKELLVGSGRLLRPTIQPSIELISGHPLGSPLTPFDRHVGSHSRRRSRTGSDNSPYLVGSPKSG